MEAKTIDDLINDIREVRDELHKDADVLRDAANILETGMYRRYIPKPKEEK